MVIVIYKSSKSILQGAETLEIGQLDDFGYKKITTVLHILCWWHAIA